MKAARVSSSAHGNQLTFEAETTKTISRVIMLASGTQITLVVIAYRDASHNAFTAASIWHRNVLLNFVRGRGLLHGDNDVTLPSIERLHRFAQMELARL